MELVHAARAHWNRDGVAEELRCSLQSAQRTLGRVDLFGRPRHGLRIARQLRFAIGGVLQALQPASADSSQSFVALQNDLQRFGSFEKRQKIEDLVLNGRSQRHRSASRYLRDCSASKK